MKKFVQRITDLCSENKRVAMFIDMDGTINEYIVFSENTVVKKIEDNYIYISPLSTVLKELEEIGNISNIDLYILSLSRTKNLTQIKKEWLKKYVSFIPEENWIILTKENGDYTNENRDEIKAMKMQEYTDYDHLILLDDDHGILKQTSNVLHNNVNVFHISSVFIWY